MKLAALSRLVGKQNVSFRRPRKTPGGRVIVDTGLPWAPPHELPAAAGDALAFEREGRVWIDAANACDARAARRLLSADAQQARALAAHAQCAAPKAPRAKRDAPGRSGDAYRARRSAAFDAALQTLRTTLKSLGIDPPAVTVVEGMIRDSEPLRHIQIPMIGIGATFTYAAGLKHLAISKYPNTVDAAREQLAAINAMAKLPKIREFAETYKIERRKLLARIKDLAKHERAQARKTEQAKPKIAIFDNALKAANRNLTKIGEKAIEPMQIHGRTSRPFEVGNMHLSGNLEPAEGLRRLEPFYHRSAADHSRQLRMIAALKPLALDAEGRRILAEAKLRVRKWSDELKQDVRVHARAEARAQQTKTAKEAKRHAPEARAKKPAATSLERARKNITRRLDKLGYRQSFWSPTGQEVDGLLTHRLTVSSGDGDVSALIDDAGKLVEIHTTRGPNAANSTFYLSVLRELRALGNAEAQAQIDQIMKEASAELNPWRRSRMDTREISPKLTKRSVKIALNNDQFAHVKSTGQRGAYFAATIGGGHDLKKNHVHITHLPSGVLAVRNIPRLMAPYLIATLEPLGEAVSQFSTGKLDQTSTNKLATFILGETRRAKEHNLGRPIDSAAARAHVARELAREIGFPAPNARDRELAPLADDAISRAEDRKIKKMESKIQKLKERSPVNAWLASQRPRPYQIRRQGNTVWINDLAGTPIATVHVDDYDGEIYLRRGSWDLHRLSVGAQKPALQRLLVDLTRMEKMWKERGDIPAVIQRQPAMDVRDLLVRIRRASKKMAVGNPESSP